MKKNLTIEGRNKLSQLAAIQNKNRSLKLQEQYNNNPRFCNHCSTKFEYEKRNSKFCNKSCAAKFNNSKFVKIQKQLIITKCFGCDNQTSNTKFCSNKCQAKFQFNEKISNWFNGEEISLGIIKNYLLQKCNNKCSICEWCSLNPFTNKIPLELHHIDGDSNNNCLNNLQILCPNCHSLTSNYKGANKESKRTYRRKDYNGAPTRNRTEI